jgi:alpha-glucoside transport system substrate-binding protein
MKTKLLVSAAALALVAGSAGAQDLMFAPGSEPERFHWDSFEALKATDLSGQTLNVMGPWTGPDQDLVLSVFAYFEAATGVKINYTGSNSSEQDIQIAVDGGTPPDIGISPQPGKVADYAKAGKVKPLPAEVADWVKANYAAGESWVSIYSAAGPDGTSALYSFPYKTDVKSLVWYSPENFEDAGYDVPATMEDLKALTEKIVADGGTPWCIGLGSDAATGWPATDWVEDMMLRTQSPDVYDKWVTNAIPFNDPAVVGAIEEFGWFAKNDKFVDGGAQAVASTDFRDSPKGMFTSPPKCYMHRQASFIPSFFGDGVKLGVDADFFYLPPYASKPDLGNPVLGAGTLVSITKDTPAARAFVEWLETPIAHEVWMAKTGFLTPYKKANPDAYSDAPTKKMGEILTNATTFRFDGSDLMPGKIGAGAFWTGMVDYTGGKSAEDVAAGIQKAWDAIK